MNITYTGQPNFSPAQKKKLDSKFTRIGKLLDRGGGSEAHVVLTAVRHLTRAEITAKYYDHSLVSVASNADPFQAVVEALEKLEKQVLKLREKWRDTKRTPDSKAWKSAPVMAPVEKPDGGEQPQRRVYRVTSYKRRKPMTLEEAMLDLDQGQDYTVYRDADTDRLRVLVRRRDGNFDLIEA